MKKIICSLLLLISIANANAQRNVVLIIADDVGTDYFGFYEDHADTVPVPNIRSLLANGVRFKNASSNPVCSATRATILTGRYAFRTGVGGIVGGLGGSGTLDTTEKSIPKLLKIYNPSIAKAQIGKWHLHNSTANNLNNPSKLGYDHFEGPFSGTLSPSYTNWSKYTNGVLSNVTTYATTENVNNAVSWLKTQNAKPFFLWMAFNAPHDPFHLPPANLHTYTTLSGTTPSISNNPKLYFKAMLQALDTELGRMFDSLKAINRFDSTDFIFIGDNGNTQKIAQITDTSRAKGSVYQYGVHVPFIISGPSVVAPGRTSDALVNLADIFATSLELMGYSNWQTQIPSNKPVDSKSILPVLKNVSTLIRPWSFTEIFRTTSDPDDGKAIRNLNYKLIRFDAGGQEFYNLSVDPTESNDLLTGTMSNTDIANYNYLCGELTTLLGNSSLCTTLLPVELISFSGNFAKSKTTLNWQTASETNNSHFEIERSEDGIHFYSIGKVQGQGNNANTSKYNYEDLMVPYGLHFYRLKQWDISGNFKLSGIVSIQNNNEGLGFQIYPNPASNVISIQSVKMLNSDMEVTLTNLQGQTLLKKDFARGSNILKMETSGISNGTYFLTLCNNGQKKSFAVTINK